MEKLVVPIIPVYLQLRSKEKPIELPFPSDSNIITGGQLKESIMVHQGTPKNRQIVVVFDSNFAIDKIVHDESRLSDSDIDNVCVLECRLGAVGINVQVRWPKESDCEAAEDREQMTVNMSLDDKVSEIKRIVESKANIKIQDCVFLIDDVVTKDAEISLSHYHIVSTSVVQLIVINYSGARNRSASMPESAMRRPMQRRSNMHTSPQTNVNMTRSSSMQNVSECDRKSVQLPSIDSAYVQKQFGHRDRQKLKKKCKSMPTIDSPGAKPKHERSKVPTLPQLKIGQASFQKGTRQGSDFASQRRRKNLKERRKHRTRESTSSQTSTDHEGEAAVTIPVTGCLSLQPSMVLLNQRTLSDPSEQNTSAGDSSGDATESDEEYDQHTSMCKHEANIPSAADYDVMSIFTNESLKDERLELRVVVSELYQVRVKWCHLGLQLQIQYSTLKSIREQHANNMDECLCEMLHYWLKQPKRGKW